MKNCILKFLVFLLPVVGFAKVRSIQWSLGAQPEASRWYYSSQIKMPATGIAKRMAELKAFQKQGKNKSCVDRGMALQKQAPGLIYWIQNVQLECLQSWAKTASGQVRLAQLVNRMNHKEFLGGPAQKIVLPNYIDSLFFLLEKKKGQAQKQKWTWFGILESLKGHLAEEQEAKLYFLMGEQAFYEQKLKAAFAFFQRSLLIKDLPVVRKRMQSIAKTFPKLKIAQPEAREEKDLNELEMGDEEKKILTRMKRALNTKDLVSAVGDGVALIENFPGSKSSDWAENQILGVYLGIAKKKSSQYREMREKIIRTMGKADYKRIWRWTRNAYAKGAYDDAYKLSELAILKANGHPDEGKILLLGGKGAHFSGNYEAAYNSYLKVFQRHAGKPQYYEALFQLGILSFRRSQFSESASFFERLIALKGVHDFEQPALYWGWRAQQAAKRPNASDLASLLIEKYPLTYYGIRASAELASGRFSWDQLEFARTPAKPKKISLTLSQQESLTWERMQLLWKAGWLEEAQAEMDFFVKGSTASEKMILSHFWAASLNHYQAIKLANEAWDEELSLKTLENVKIVYPKEFSYSVDKYSKQFGVPASLVYGLIRQESSFRVRAQSPSNAHGLMQIVPITARDIQSYLKLKKPIQIPEDLYDPHKNIRFGTSYIMRMVRAFNGHVPLGLAAYNAGIGRIRQWMSARDEIENLTKDLKSDPMSELWIEELPWSETRYYVKAVLRNLLLYEAMDKEEIQLKNPAWVLPSSKKS